MKPWAAVALAAGAGLGVWALWRVQEGTPYAAFQSLTPPADLDPRFWRSDSGLAQGLPNIPPPELWPNVRASMAALGRLEAFLGGKVVLTSAYRSALVNAFVGGVASSKHRAALALDVQPRAGGNITLADIQNAGDTLSGVFSSVMPESKDGKRWIHLEVADG